MKFAIHAHVYYRELWDELSGCIRNFPKGEYDLFVTTPHVDADFERRVMAEYPRCDYRVVENRGYDVGPFIDVLNRLDLSQYEFVVKLHTKRDCCALVNFRPLRGNAWRQLLLGFCATEQSLKRTLKCFADDSSIGMVAHPYLVTGIGDFLEDGRIRVQADELLRQMRLKPLHHEFVSGTMFIVRAHLMRTLQGNLSLADFKEVVCHELGTKAHVCERLLGYLVSAQGMRIEGYFSSFNFNKVLLFPLVPLHWVGRAVKQLCEPLVSTWKKFRKWGWIGVWNYFGGDKLRQRRFERFLLRNAQKYPLQPQRGITIIAPLTLGNSLNKVMRDLAFSLRDAGIPFQAYDVAKSKMVVAEDVASILTKDEDFRVRKYCHIITMMGCSLPKIPGVKTHTVYFWEFESGLPEAHPEIKQCEGVIGMSLFNARYYETIPECAGKVHYIRYPFRFAPGDMDAPEVIRKKYGIPTDAFVVFFNFDFGSSRHRKNPDDVIRAFAGALGKESNAYLVFKTMHAKAHGEEVDELNHLAETEGFKDRFVMISSYIPNRDLYGLTNASDVYLSLHRGEGFGLGIAEAMSLGKPVIVSDYSSTAEFCDLSNSLPIPCRLVPVSPEMIDHGDYVHVAMWAEPSVPDAVEALKKIYHDNSLRRQLGRAGREFLAYHFSLESFAKSLTLFLDS